MDTPPANLATLFAHADPREPVASSALFAALYGELHRIAERELQRQGWGVSLGATSLLHEAYVDLSRKDGAMFPDRQRFMAYASRVMRGLIVDYARNRRAQKRGGQFELTALSTDVLDSARTAEEAVELVRISEALDDLSSMDPVLAEIVDLKYFCGFSFEEIAVMKNLSDRTVRRYWTKARAYLHATLRQGAPLAD